MFRLWCCITARVARRSSARTTARHLASTSASAQLEVHPDVASAIAAGRPVVALETTIITHGMPYPENLNTALEVEDIVRSLNATPATIGIVDGKVHVGLTKTQLERLADPSLMERSYKVSRRDLPYILSQGHCGGTTVSATMLCAHKAGIPVFVTGGLGGVHREGENTLDVSADLVELGKTPVAVVCGGVKSILDIGRTLEVLETQGVPVATYGPSNDFPAFFTQNSGFQAPFNLETPLECARMIESSLSFGVGSGVLIAVPIPADASCLGEDIDLVIQQALADAKNMGVTGKAVTPYVLQRVNELTGGKSLQANIQLIKNNARVGSQIAVELATLRGGSRHPARRLRGGSRHPARRLREEHEWKRRGGRIHAHMHKKPVVIGGSILDFVAKVNSRQIKNEGTNPGNLRQTFGGVGRNIAECLARLETYPFFISAIGSDTNGWRISKYLREYRISLKGMYQSTELPTATYCAVIDGSGEMYCAIGDMDVHKCITMEWVQTFSQRLEKASFVCMDGNTSEETIQYVCDTCWEMGVPVWYEPTCIDKSTKVITAGCHSKLSYTSPNLTELRNMYHKLTGEAVSSPGPTTDLSTEEKLAECTKLSPPLLSHIPNLLISLGSDGVVYARKCGGDLEFLHYPAATSHLLPAKVVNVTGAGDSFVGAMVSSLTQGLDADTSIKAGLRAAYLSIGSINAVSEKVTPELFTEKSIREWAPWKPTRL